MFPYLVDERECKNLKKSDSNQRCDKYDEDIKQGDYYCLKNNYISPRNHLESKQI